MSAIKLKGLNSGETTLKASNDGGSNTIWLPDYDGTVPVVGQWVAPTLLNGWTNYGQSFPTAGWRVVPAGIQLKGLVRYGDDSSIIFDLPVDVTPSETHIFSGLMSGGVARVDVRNSGSVFLSGSYTSWVSLSQIIFPVES